MSEHLERLREIVAGAGKPFIAYAMSCYFDQRHLDALSWAIAQCERVAEAERLIETLREACEATRLVYVTNRLYDKCPMGLRAALAAADKWKEGRCPAIAPAT